MCLSCGSQIVTVNFVTVRVAWNLFENGRSFNLLLYAYKLEPHSPVFMSNIFSIFNITSRLREKEHGSQDSENISYKFISFKI